MSPFHFDDRFADTLLGGGVHPDDAPPGLQDVARMIQAARVPASAGELAGEDRLVAAFAAAVDVPRALTPNIRRRRPMLASLLSAKVAAVAATLLLGGGVAAAATGSLPSPVQSALARDLSHVGISVPDPGSHGHAPTSPPTGSTSGSTGSPTSGSGSPSTPGVAPGHGPVVPGPSTMGLCTAYAASGRASGPKGKPVAFAQLQAAAAAKGESVEQFCASVTAPTTSTSTPTTEPTTPTSSPTEPTTTPSSGQGHGGPPSSVPVGPPSGVAPGPPSSVPVSPPSSNGRH